MNSEQIKKRIGDLSEQEEWNHLYVFPGGIRTRDEDIESPGYNTHKWQRLKPVIEFLNPEGKTMLDVGCSDGYFSIMSANLGMKYVLGTDLDPLRVERSNFAKEVYNIKNVDFKLLDVYGLHPTPRFDIVLGLGLIHRVPDIDLCIKKLADIGENVIIEFKTLNSEEDICEYAGGKTKSNKYNGLHHIPTQKYVINKMKNHGFPNYYLIDDEYSTLKYKRTIALFSRSPVK